MTCRRIQLRWSATVAVAIHCLAQSAFADASGLLVRGGDVSELPRLEHYGARYFDDGAQKDCLQIFKAHGINLVRLRLYNDPGNTDFHPSRLLDPLGWQNPEHTLALARRAKLLGFQIQLTFHYSDYWSNPGVQHKPHEWERLDFPQLSGALVAFTTNFLGRMVAQGTPPEFVSLGNEIQGGILFPEGASTNFPRLAEFLTQGYRAVKSTSPSSRIVLHVSDPRTNAVNWFFDCCVSNAVPWDVTGVSYYPFWSRLAVADLAPHLDQLHRRFGRPVLIMETGYNWSTNNCDGRRGQLEDNGPELFPSTPQGQADFLRGCVKAASSVPDGGCLGLIYWDPVFICVPGQGWENGARNVVANTALFDFNGHALPALKSFESGNNFKSDRVDLMPTNTTPPLPVAATLVDSQATPEARLLMNDLVAAYGKVTWSGQAELNEVTNIFNLTGHKPIIICGDLMNYSPSSIAFGAKPGQMVESYIAMHKQGHVLSFCWHWNAPTNLLNTPDHKWWRGFYTDATSFDLGAALADTNSTGYHLILRDIDAIGGQLKKLSDKQIPVLWRPLHEAEGKWFWWGAKGPEPFKKLWRLMFNRLTIDHGLHNLIWVLTNDDPAWYPGDDVVDIIGIDAYPNDRSDPLSGRWEAMKARFDGKKLIALTEFGGVPDIEKMHEFGVWFSYFSPWSGPYGPTSSPTNAVLRIYQSSEVLTLDGASKVR